MIRKGIALIVMLLFLITSGATSIINPLTKSISIDLDNNAYSHTVLAEFGTFTMCITCKYAHEALIYLFFNRGDDYPFYYVTHVYDVNTHAYQRVKNELNLTVSPTVFWDGGFRKDIGAPSNASVVTKYKKSLNTCGNRTVADIDLTVDATWLGAVNNKPGYGATKVPINQCMNWTNSEMVVNVSVRNNGSNSYNGHLHVYVCDINSSMGWYDSADRLYTMAFLCYAFDRNLALGGGGTWNGSKNWDGMDHHNGTHKYQFVSEANTIVIASMLDRENNAYADETTGVRVGVGTDPKTFTVYFGNTTPPPLVKSNITTMSYCPGKLEWNTTYFWKVDVWNNKGEKTEGEIWSFTTRDNNPPNIPSNPFPSNGSINDTICPKNFSWAGGDPDGDNVTYDVYFGRCGEALTVIASNITTPWYQDSHKLEFETCYNWMVVANDDYGLITSGPIWTFTTQKNLPPYMPSDPHPEDGEEGVPLDAIFNWTGGDPNPCDTVTYDVWFDTADPPRFIKSHNQTETCFDPPDDLELYQTYYWKVVAWDSRGLKTEGPIWRFSTDIPIPPEIEFINPQFGYIHLFGNPLFPTPFNIIVDTISIGGFKAKPIQINVTDDNLSAILSINDVDQGHGTWNPKTGYYEWYWTERAFGTHIFEAKVIDPYGIGDIATIKVWCFCP